MSKIHPPCNICEKNYKTAKEMITHRNETHSKAAIEISKQVLKTRETNMKKVACKNTKTPEKEVQMRSLLKISYLLLNC